MLIIYMLIYYYMLIVTVDMENSQQWYPDDIF